jgi:nitrate/nitrite transporter NarK
MAALTLAALGIYSCLGTFWTLPTSFLGSTAAAAGIALVNSVGNLGGFAGPYAVGFITDRTGSSYGGMLLLAAMITLAGILVFVGRQKQKTEQVEEVAAPTGT